MKDSLLDQVPSLRGLRISSSDGARGYGCEVIRYISMIRCRSLGLDALPSLIGKHGVIRGPEYATAVDVQRPQYGRGSLVDR